MRFPPESTHENRLSGGFITGDEESPVGATAPPHLAPLTVASAHSLACRAWSLESPYRLPYQIAIIEQFSKLVYITVNYFLKSSSFL